MTSKQPSFTHTYSKITMCVQSVQACMVFLMVKDPQDVLEQLLAFVHFGHVSLPGECQCLRRGDIATITKYS